MPCAQGKLYFDEVYMEGVGDHLVGVEAEGAEGEHLPVQLWNPQTQNEVPLKPMGGRAKPLPRVYED